VSRRTLLLVGGAAALLAAALITVSLVGGGDDDDADAAPTTQATTAGTSTGPLPELETDSLQVIEGLPQNGVVLGRATAPAVIVENADLQCPFCAQFAAESLPGLVEKWVRPGKASIEFRGLAVLGDDSGKALRFVLAAAERDRGWSAIELLYENQGEENAGWVTDDLLRAVAQELDLDPDAMVAAASSTRFDEAIARNRVLAEQDGVQGTPAFFVGRRGGGTTVPIGTGAIEASAFDQALTIATGS
jgi:protein-disulfide isomerase